MARITDAGVQEFETRHIGVVRKAAPECAVLLRNEGILPLAAAGQIALYGSGARRTIKGGTGSGDVNVRHFITVEEGLTNAGFTVTSGAWLDSYEEVMNNARAAWIRDLQAQAKAAGTSTMMFAMGAVMPEPDYELPLDAPGDTAVYVLSRISGEGSDRRPVAGDIDLTATEKRDILALNERYEKFVLVLNVGGMVNLAPVADVKCILLLGQLGTPTGDVCADLLLGKASPSGKLAMTWAPIGDYPSTESFGDPDDTPYSEGIYVGYRYFDTVGKAPTYPFGYGLSYTTFRVDGGAAALDGPDVSVTASVCNTGGREGKEVVQVYVSSPQGKLDRPMQELRAFVKTSSLQPGMTECVTARFALRDLAAYCEKCAAWVMEAGDYVIRIGTSSADTKPLAVIRLDETVVTEQLQNRFGESGFADFVPEAPVTAPVPEGLPVLEVKAADLAAAKPDCGSAAPVSGAACSCACAEGSAERVSWKAVKAGEKSIDDFMAGLTQDELIDICIGTYSDEAGLGSVIGAGSTLIAGGAGDTTHRVASADLESLSMTDGPAGIRVNTMYKDVGGVLKPLDSALAGFMEFMSEEEMATMAQMFGQPQPPTQEELDAPVNYQYCIAIPIGTALAQSFNEEMCAGLGDIVGEEMEIFDINYWLAPAQNIQRSPLCGRNFEYYSEDPLLTGKISAAITKGVQAHPGRGTTIKHFAANNQETNRYGSNSLVSERALREIYLKGFEIAVKESSPEAIMTSYNLINGEHSCNRRDLLTDVLRGEWGYRGIVMTDWYITTGMMVTPGRKHGPASAAGCVKAGNNVTMPGAVSDAEDIRTALTDPSHPYALTDADLRACARPVLEAVLRLKG